MEEARELLVTADTDQRTAYFERVCLRAPACEVTTALLSILCTLYPLSVPAAARLGVREGGGLPGGGAR